MPVGICQKFPCSMSSVSIDDARESDIRVKSSSYLNFSRDFVVQFSASRYIMGVDLYNRVKGYDHLNFPRAFVGLNFKRLDTLCA